MPTPSDDRVAPFDHAAMAADLLAWYARSRRALPWRALPGAAPPDPYAVWLSEVMLQQTTVAAVKPYFARFLALWPTVGELAAAPVEAVMRAWAGLGYYSRARNLHATATRVAAEHGGRFPDTEAGLRALPGVGAYTAAAVAAIAFGRDAVVVDGNVERVMARLHAVEQPLATVRPRLRQLMAAATPAGHAGDFAQAVMDLGATICVPRNPACTICPVSIPCRARQAGLQTTLPRKAPKRTVPLRHGVAYYLRDARGRVLVRRRPPTGLLGGLVDLPGSAWADVSEEPAMNTEDGMILAGRVTHTFTHFRLFLDVMIPGPGWDAPHDEPCWLVPDEDLDAEALATLTRNALRLARAAHPGSRPPASPTRHRS